MARIREGVNQIPRWHAKRLIPCYYECGRTIKLRYTHESDVCPSCDACWRFGCDLDSAGRCSRECGHTPPMETPEVRRKRMLEVLANGGSPF